MLEMVKLGTHLVVRLSESNPRFNLLHVYFVLEVWNLLIIIGYDVYFGRWQCLQDREHEFLKCTLEQLEVGRGICASG
jgi:hypothetical protein